MQNFLKRAWAEIHLDRLDDNYNKCKSLINKNTEFLAVVKANAYGHGDSDIAPHLQKLGVKWFAVSNLNEALRLRNMGITGEILILGYTSPEYTDVLIENNIIQTITDIDHAVALSNAVKSKELRAHIKLDTGMGRIGVRHNDNNETADECEKIYKLKGLKVEGLFTHFAVADSDDEDDIKYTQMQRDKIKSVYDILKQRGINIECMHYLNSAGATYLKDSDSKLARFGIMLYGLYPNHALELPVKLEPVMELKTIVSYIKTIHKGDYVSYGRTFKADKDIKLATLTIGYADGYSRLLSSKSEVLINGKRAKSVGRVCMDQMMVDVTDIDVKVGDVATLFGFDGDDCITPDDLADIYGTIGYEIICGISKRVPRVVYDKSGIIEVINS